MRELMLASVALAGALGAGTLAAGAAHAFDRASWDYGVTATAAAGVVGSTTGAPPEKAERFRYGSLTRLWLSGRQITEEGLDLSLHLGVLLERKTPFTTREDDWLETAYIEVISAFGTTRIGRVEGAAATMAMLPTSPFREVTLNDSGGGVTMDPFVSMTTHGLLTNSAPVAAGRDVKFSMMSPRLFGAQLGFSLTPLRQRSAGALGTGAMDAPAGFGNMFWEVAAGYRTNLDGIGLGLSASYGQGNAGVAEERPQEWQLGARVNAGNWRLGAAYKGSRTDGLNATRTGSDWDAGVEYRFDEWSIGLSYAQARGQGARVAERDQNAVIGGFSYQISETVQVGFGGAWLRDRSGGLPRRETGYAAFTEVGVSF